MKTGDVVDRVNRVAISFLSVICLFHVVDFASRFLLGTQTFFLVDDDPLISLRIANNIAHGLGPYFNAGEHVAANTSLSWPFLVAPVFHFTALPEAVLVLSIISVLLTAITFALIAFSATSTRSAVLSLATLLLLPGFIHYAPSTWEHIPQSIFTTAALLILLGRPKRLANYSLPLSLVLLDVAFLLRPDTLPLMVVPGLVILVQLRHKIRMSSLAALAFTAICMVGYYGLHHFFYGDFVPNTYYLKVAFGLSSVRVGLVYTAIEAIKCASPMFIVALVLLWAPNRHAWKSGEQLVLLALILQCIYIILVGGDVFPDGRYYLLILPVAVLLFWEKADEQVFCTAGFKSPISALAVALVAAVILTSTLYTILREEERVSDLHGFSESGYFMPQVTQAQIDQIKLVPTIQEHIRPEDGSIGLFWLGALSYYLPGYSATDFLGKADPVIAHEPVKWGPVGHNKWDIDFSLRNRNIAVIPFALIPEAVAHQNLLNHAPLSGSSDLELNPYLKQHYVWLSPEQLGVRGQWGLYVRNDLASRFQTGGTSARK